MPTTLPTSRSYELLAGERRVGAFLLRGHMRSGTNWVGALLNLHPEICCTGEFHFERLRPAFETFASRPWMVSGFTEVKELGEKAIERFAADCLREIARSNPEARLIGDRTPAMIEPELPGAPIIHITRDGRDVLVSWAFHCLRLDHPVADETLEAWRQKRIGRDMAAHPAELLNDEAVVRLRARMWAEYVANHTEAKAKAEAGTLGSDLLSLQYESLHADVESGRREMYTFLGLDPDLAAPVSTESKTEAGFGDRAEDPNDFYRAGKVRGFEKYFTDDVKRWYKEEAGEALIVAGYEKDLNW
ncbi:MAG: sulfotransferase [Phycisphaerales bacterium]|nr:sulfotransferase [Phycisphaerales bacterium]MCB9836462.1 sulfotransferase [Phycisphaera sp.]